MLNRIRATDLRIQRVPEQRPLLCQLVSRSVQGRLQVCPANMTYHNKRLPLKARKFRCINRNGEEVGKVVRQSDVNREILASAFEVCAKRLMRTARKATD